ncbi:hypothetical protein QEM35_002498 [Pseudomonas putida]|nr:hypothetical protein [Pseudomonas putida]EKT4513374.1 hypothetical protein [Pseudomonas putida]
MSTTQTIDSDHVAKLWATGAIEALRAIKQEGGKWSLQARVGTNWLSVRSRRQELRLWSSLDTLERFCNCTGAKQLTIQL